ncbi:hypothetical protein LTR39_005514 [Cryomyces antarcticus]|nr:hypothetical protein LTR39_005514 [Cryomyces antarcticus]
MAKPFIAAYKAGDSEPDAYITEDQLVYWYRPSPSTASCDSTDTTMVAANNDSGNYFMGRPNGWQDAADSVFVVSLLTKPGVVHINSGNTSHTFHAPAGASSYSVPMGIGKQSFALERGDKTVIGSTSLKDIIDGCVCGLYNYNAYVGTVPQGEPFPDQMGPAGLGSLTIGLHVSTCAATPSLGTSTLPYPSPTATSATATAITKSGSAAPTSSSAHGYGYIRTASSAKPTEKPSGPTKTKEPVCRFTTICE